MAGHVDRTVKKLVIKRVFDAVDITLCNAVNEAKYRAACRALMTNDMNDAVHRAVGLAR